MTRTMNKYSQLFSWIESQESDELRLTFDEIEKISGKALDHSFLQYKKELKGWSVEKISMKNKTVLFKKN